MQELLVSVQLFRNVFQNDLFRLDDRLRVKIADFGLCRKVDIETELYVQLHERDLPVRWFPPEIVEQGVSYETCLAWTACWFNSTIKTNTFQISVRNNIGHLVIRYRDLGTIYTWRNSVQEDGQLVTDPPMAQGIRDQ